VESPRPPDQPLAAVPACVMPQLLPKLGMEETPRPGGCLAPRRDGRPCRYPAVAASGYCCAHDPGRAAEHLEASPKPLSAGELAALYQRLDRALEEVQTGTLDPRQALVLAGLVRAMCATPQLGEQRSRFEGLAAQLGNGRRREA